MSIETSYPETTLEPTLDQCLPVLPLTRDRRVARWISRVTSPPVLAVGGTFLTASEIASRSAWFWAFFIVLFTIGGPAGYVYWLKRRGKVTDFDVYLREQRFWPYIVSLSCGAISWLILAVFHAPRLFTVISGATVAQGLIMFLINQRWKISAHASGTAGMAVLVCELLGRASMPILLIIPLVGWSRVRLGRHTRGQVIAGSALGALLFFAAFTIWY